MPSVAYQPTHTLTRRQTAFLLVGAAAIGIGLLSAASEAHAGKPRTPSYQYTLVDLVEQAGEVQAINQLHSGVVEAVGRLTGTVGVPSYWMVDSSGAVLLSSSLQTPLPGENATVELSQASDVNQNGVIVGSQREVMDGQQYTRPLLWRNGSAAAVELPLPEGNVTGAFATSINDDGIVVGAVDHGLVAWVVGVNQGQVSASDCVPIWMDASLWFYPSQITNSGYVSVDVRSATETHAFRLRLQSNEVTPPVSEVAGSRTALFPGALFSSASGVNEAGTVCGQVNFADGVEAFALTLQGQLLNLPGLPAVRQDGFDYEPTHNVRADAINNSTPLQIVGDAARNIYKRGKFYNSEQFPVRWDAATQITQLEPVTSQTLELTWVSAINDAGWIAGSRRDDTSGGNRPVVLIRKP